MITRRDLLSGGGVSVAAVGTDGLTRATLAQEKPPQGVNAITLCGFAEPGDPGRGAVYRRGSSEGPMAVQDASGRWWELTAGKDIWAGWFGALGKRDDTESFEAALKFLGARGGGTLHISSGEYYVAKPRGTEVIGAGDDGAAPHPSFETLPAETKINQAYCLKVPNNVWVLGDGRVTFHGAYRYGNAGLNETICFVPDGAASYTTRLENIAFNKYFMAFASVRRCAVVESHFENLQFSSCAVGIYAQNLERCKFRSLTSFQTACLIAVGGQWATRQDNFDEGGGFADKCSFDDVHNIFGRGLGPEESSIDEYFDQHFFRTYNNVSRLGPPQQPSSITRMFPYLGLCGRAIYLMARHGRPSNANRFGLISHAFAPRPAVWIDYAVACSGSIVYLEVCGFADPHNRARAIGADGIDPYLGPGRRMPAFVKGFDCQVDAQSVFSDRLIADAIRPEPWVFASQIAHLSTSWSFPGEVRARRFVSEEPLHHLAGMAFTTANVRANAPAVLPVLDPHNSEAAMALLIALPGDSRSSSGTYLVTYAAGAVNAHLLAGEDVIEFSLDASAQAICRTRDNVARQIVIFGRTP